MKCEVIFGVRDSRERMDATVTNIRDEEEEFSGKRKKK